jgi:prepilin-type N-terminal cleavage/methylation domain-containing protein
MADICKKNRGFTLVEILFSMAILVTLLVGVMSLLVYCMNLQDTSRNTALVINQMREKLEEIKALDFDTVISTYQNKPLTVALNGINGQVRIEIIKDQFNNIYVAGSNNSLINMRVIAGWVQRAGRTIGEGTVVGSNFILSDTNSNGVIDSPLELITAVCRKQ